MAVLDIQRRGQQIGRLRIGQQVQAASGKMRPARLDTWRITTQSRPVADAVAELYGGTVREWNNEWEVITDRSEIGVTVPPRDGVVSQWYEMWNAAGCLRRCDSQHERISGGPCLCPHAADPGDRDEAERCAFERSLLAAENPPRACKLTTRISVMIPDLPGLGIFRLDTKSHNAGVEIGDTAELMEMARERGIFLPAMLRIEQRSGKVDGKPAVFPVPCLQVLVTFRQILSGELQARGLSAQLPPRPAAARAIAAPADAAPEPAHEEADGAPWFYQRALAELDAAAVSGIAEDAKAAGVMDDFVCTDREHDVWEPLRAALQGVWRARSAP